jgi:hypothetical protein
MYSEKKSASATGLRDFPLLYLHNAEKRNTASNISTPDWTCRALKHWPNGSFTKKQKQYQPYLEYYHHYFLRGSTQGNSINYQQRISQGIWTKPSQQPYQQEVPLLPPYTPTYHPSLLKFHQIYNDNLIYRLWINSRNMNIHKTCQHTLWTKVLMIFCHDLHPYISHTGTSKKKITNLDR